MVLACRPGLGEFFLEYGLCDEIVKVDKRTEGGGADALKQLAQREWDYIFVPHESVRTALWMRKLRAKHKVAFHKWWNGWIYDKRVVKPKDFPDALRQLSLLTAVDSRLAEMFGEEEVQSLRNSSEQNTVDFDEPKIPEWASMNVIPHDSWGPYGARKLRDRAAGAVSRRSDPQSDKGKLIFLAPGSVWNTKRWTKKGYTELAAMLVKRGYEVELVGSPAERELCEEITKAVPQAKNRAGLTTMSDLVKRLNQGVAIVSNDSGAMHAASAAGLPTVAVFGPTVLTLGFRPWQNQAIVVQTPLKCRPCGKHGHQKCPIGTHECMEKISADDVMNALESLI